MKKLALAALAVLAMTGCKVKEDYDLNATREQSKATCGEYGGKHSVMYLSYNVTGKPWESTCINPTTGNSFTVYFTGVLK